MIRCTLWRMGHGWPELATGMDAVFVAAALRVSVSLLIFGLILLWKKPSRRAIRRFFSINYSTDSEGWDSSAGFLEESITFWAVETPGDPPPVLLAQP